MDSINATVTSPTACRLLCLPALASASHSEALLALIALFTVQLLVTYFYAIGRWHYVNRFEKSSKDRSRLPPRYPSLVPYVGSAISFAWDNANFIRRATCYAGRLTSSRISFLGFEIYAFQDRHTIAKIWKQPTLSSPISMFIYVLNYFFGLSKSAQLVYRADNSGPFPKPYAGSTVPSKDRIDHITIHGFLQAFSGPGLQPTTRRYMNALATRLEAKNISTEWIEMADLSTFFRDVVGSALVESIYGPGMLQVNPDFVRHLWEFDAAVPWLARAVPSFIKPSAHKPRQDCVDQVKRWYAYAREHFDSACIAPDGDGDPYWGSNLMRYRQENLLAVKGHDDDALARLDLGLAWGAVGNTIPCAMLSAFHIYRDPVLLDRVRDSVDSLLGDTHFMDMDANELSKNPLLSSIYAEVLRLYVKTYFMVSSPHEQVDLGRWVLPKGRIGIMNAGVSHMDESFWNSGGGEYPVTTFWADRFIVDPTDPQSGPVAPHVRESPDMDELQSAWGNATEPFFSMEGTRGSWFPYGGGHSICPGRFLAKRAIVFTCALLARDYDIEMLSDRLEMDNWRFGLGVGSIKHALPFRIRRRSS